MNGRMFEQNKGPYKNYAVLEGRGDQAKCNKKHEGGGNAFLVGDTGDLTKNHAILSWGQAKNHAVSE